MGSDSGNGTIGKDERGRFLPGNHLSNGRPKGSKSPFEAHRATLRSVLVEYCTKEKLLEWLIDLEGIARVSPKDADRIGAYRLLCSYVLGAPSPEITIRDEMSEAVRLAREEIASIVLPDAKAETH